MQLFAPTFYRVFRSTLTTLTLFSALLVLSLPAYAITDATFKLRVQRNSLDYTQLTVDFDNYDGTVPATFSSDSVENSGGDSTGDRYVCREVDSSSTPPCATSAGSIVTEQLEVVVSGLNSNTPWTIYYEGSFDGSPSPSDYNDRNENGTTDDPFASFSGTGNGTFTEVFNDDSLGTYVYIVIDADPTVLAALDTDGDGTLNGVDTDDDNDGVSDTQEATDGTDPLNPLSFKDTDDDWVSDAQETLDGTSATNANDYKDANFNGIPDSLQAHVCLADDFSATTLDSSWNTLTGSTYTPNITAVGGNNRLRVTSAVGTDGSNGVVSKDIKIPADRYLVFDFDSAAYGGLSATGSEEGADGVAVILSDYSVAPVIGGYGGYLGYMQGGGRDGFAGGWLGIGITEFETFSGGSGGVGNNAITVRGSGAGTTGYGVIKAVGGLTPAIGYPGSGGDSSGSRYRMIVDSSNGTNSFVSVLRNSGSGFTNVIANKDVAAASGQAALPDNLRISFSGGIGASTNNHEFDNLRVLSPNCASIFSSVSAQNPRIANDLSKTSFDVVLSRPVPTGETVTVQYQTADGTAIAGTDYTAISASTLTFDAGEQSKTIDVTMIDISSADTGKTFDLRLNTPSSTEAGTAFLGTGNSTYTIDIADTDGDGTFDAFDTDDDNDGVPDTADPSPFIYGAPDSDGDGVPNYFDLGGLGFISGTFVDSSGNTLDTDSDGLLDYVETYQEKNSPPVFNNIEAIFTDTSINASDANLRAIDVGDIDLDGDLDVVIAQSQTNSSIIWYRNDGNNSFTRQVLQTFNGTSFWVVALEDITGDGYLDIVTANESSSAKIHVFVHSGDRSDPYPDDAVLSATVANRIQKFKVADVTNDGIADVVFSSISDDTLEYIPSDPSAEVLSASPVTIGTGLDYAFSVDVDNAGNVYLVSTNDKQLSLFTNNGTSNPFGSANSSLTVIPGPTGFSPNLLSAENVDDDAKAEIIVSNNGQSLYLFDHDGSSWTYSEILDGTVVTALNSFGIHEIDTLDIDLDGDIDILLSTWQSDDVLWLENDGSQTFGNSSARIVLNGSSSTEPLTVASGDFNQDGISDFVTPVGTALTLYSGQFNQSFNVPENTVYAGNVEATDPEGETVSYLLSGVDASVFSVSSSGVLEFDSPADFETPTDNGLNNVYEVTATATDASGTSMSANYTITIVNDTTAQLFENSTPLETAQTNTSVSFSLDLDGESTVYAVLLADNASVPNASQVIAGNDATNNPAIDATSLSISNSDNTGTISLGNIVLNTAKVYDAFFVTRDDEGNKSAVVGPINITMLDSDDDGIVNALDVDDDNDGVPDAQDNNPQVFGATDTDGDGIPDYFDTGCIGTCGPNTYIEDGTNGTTLGDAKDSDGDGVSDYTEAFSGANDAPVFNNVDAVFSPTVIDNALSSRTVVVADIDNDGFEDIVSASQVSASTTTIVRWYKNNQSGGFSSAITVVDSAVDSIRSVAVNDINNDGFLDIAYAGFADNELGWILHSGDVSNPYGGQSEDTRTPIVKNNGAGVEKLRLLDVTNDGLPDYVAADNGNSRLFYIKNDGTTNPFGTAAVTLIANDLALPRGLSVVDFDNDGDMDVVAASTSTGQIRLYTNDGSATPFGAVNTSDSVIATVVGATALVEVADIDNDGDSDVFTQEGAETFVYYRNNGDGTYTRELVADTAVLDGLHSISFGDIDYDGDIDLMATDYVNHKIMWFENDGSGGFGNASAKYVLEGTNQSPLEATFGDFNQDQITDFVAPLSGVTDLVVYQGALNYSKSFEENTLRVLDTGARDPDGDDITYTLSGTDATLFDIDDDGILYFDTAPDFEDPQDVGGNNVYNVNVRASDGTPDALGTLSRTANLTITITNDTTSPAFENSTPALSLSANTTLSLRADINEQAKVFGMLLDNSASCPSAAQLIAQSTTGITGAINAQSGDTAGVTSVIELDYTGLTVSDADVLKACTVARDADGNTNAVQTTTYTFVDTDLDGSFDGFDTDDDNDGVPDAQDNTPLVNGATDTDGDGVPDYFDTQCDRVNTPSICGAAIYIEDGTGGTTLGAPKDADDDGISDYIEAFPGVNDAPYFNEAGRQSSLNFDASAKQYADVSNQTLDLTGDAVTISAWINPSNTDNTEIFVKNTDGLGGLEVDYGLRYRTSGKVTMHIGDGVGYYACTSDALLGTNNWYYLTSTFEKGVGIKLYFDGVAQATTCTEYNGVNANSTFGTSGEATFARYSYTGDASGGIQYFDGGLDEFAVWDDVLSQAEISAIYNNGNYVPTLLSSQGDYDSQDELEAYWRFEDPSSGVITDATDNGNDATLRGSSLPTFVTRPLEVAVRAGQVDIRSFDVTDLDGDAVSFSVTGADRALFSIDTTGALSFNSAPQFDKTTPANNIKTITLNVTDGSLSGTLPLKVVISPVDITIDQSLANAIGAALASNDVVIDTAGPSTIDISTASLLGTGIIKIDADITWSSNNKLTLNALKDILQTGDLSASGNTASLEVFYGASSSSTSPASGTEYNLNRRTYAKTTLSGTTPTLLIANNTYDVFNSHNTIAQLRAMGTTASDYIALGESFTLSDTYTTAFIANEFNGTFNGLGHEISGLKIAEPSTGSIGFFSDLQDANVSNVGVTNLSLVTNGSNVTHATGDKLFVGGIAGRVIGTDATNVTTISGVWSSGAIGTKAGSTQEIFFAGGLIGQHNKGTMNLSRAYSSVNVSANGSKSAMHSIGGLVGEISPFSKFTDYSPTQIAASNSQMVSNIDQVYSIGTIVEGAGSSNGGYFGVGGLVGVIYNPGNTNLSNFFSRGKSTTADHPSFGGIAGFALSSSGNSIAITTGYTTEERVGPANVIDKDSGYPSVPTVFNAADLATQTSSGTVLPTGFSSDYWNVGAAPSLKSLPPLQTTVYIKQTKEGGAVGSPDLDYELRDASKTPITIASLVGITGVTGIANYTIDDDTVAGTYEVAYLGGLSFTGDGADNYVLAPDSTTTYVLSSRALVTYTVADLNVTFGSAFSSLPTPDYTGGTPTGTSTVSVFNASNADVTSAYTAGTLAVGTYTLKAELSGDSVFAIAGSGNTTGTLTVLTDTDGDGVADINDAFPNDASETTDTDGDGVGDNSDAFPNDPNEDTDTDGDGVGDNGDAFPTDPTRSSPPAPPTDTDGDGVPDDQDAFPNDPNESVDSDGDGVGDNSDPDRDGDGVRNEDDDFPDDSTEDTDTDGDGIGNNTDTDDDGDGIPDSQDTMPQDARPDSDGDGVADEDDAFPNDPNESVDTDGDGIGNNADTDDDNDGIPDGQDTNPLDPRPDTDGDGVPDDEDAFPNDPNESSDIDGDGIGDNADTDRDGDGVNNDQDAFPNDEDEDTDTDGDGVGDNSDAFPNDENEDTDTDGDGIGNNADTDDDNDGIPDDQDTAPLDARPDSDGDGVPDDEDAFPNDPNESADLDGDGIGDNADTDRDGDGVPNDQDAFPNDDSEDTDTDGDGVGDNSDALPNDPLETEDTDGDGIGNNRDTDDDNDGIDDIDDTDPLIPFVDTDGDGVPDSLDAFPNDPNESVDSDGDGVGDNSDAFPNDPNESADSDGVGDNGDAFPNDPNESADSDGDGVGNNSDAFPNDADEDTDTDGDGIGNNADTDDDNDGIPDDQDTAPLDARPDSDGDGVPDDEDTDTDGDGVGDNSDALPNDPLETEDTDGDGIGNSRDTDDDNDGIPDTSDTDPLTQLDTDGDGVPDHLDAFPNDANESVDTDGDGIGNNADRDNDNDGIPDSSDTDPLTQLDTDGDGVPDHLDAFPNDANESVDTDGDGIGNNTDTDDDNDGIPDSSDTDPLTQLDTDGDGVPDHLDAFPNDANESVDTDGDGIGNNADLDDDNDGIPDTSDTYPLTQLDTDGDGVPDHLDAFPNDANESVDTDGDGIGNNADTDDDNDGIPDTIDTDPKTALDTDGDGVPDHLDAFPNDANESVDTDGDGIGNNSDPDIDGDGILNGDDQFPEDSLRAGDTDGDGIDDINDDDIDGDGIINSEDRDANGDGIDDNLGINIAPVAIDDAFEIFSTDATELNVLANDSDTDGDTLRITGVNSDVGTATVVGDSIIFSAPQNYTGKTTLKYNINDGMGGSASANITLTIDTYDDTGEAPLVLPPEDISVNATGLYTKVDLGVAKAFDSRGNALPVSLVDGITLFRPGLNTAYWEAIDELGNRTVSSQRVSVLPLVSFSKNQIVKEGGRVQVDVLLNGTSPEYPVVVNYRVKGTANAADHTLTKGLLNITSGNKGTISFDTLVDDIEEGNETLILEFFDELNAVNEITHVVTITERELAPRLSIGVRQGGKAALTVAKDAGMVTIQTKLTSDTDAAFSFAWQVDNSMQDTDTIARNFTFDPSDMSEGVYSVVVNVSSDNADIPPAKAQIELAVVNTLAPLDANTDTDKDGIPDSEEGYADSDGDGIPDYADAISETNVLPALDKDASAYLLETEPGLAMRLGKANIVNRVAGARVPQGVAVNDENFSAIGGVHDFEIRNLALIGQTVNVVIPQTRALPSNASYAKYSEADGWVAFVEDGNNAIASTKGELGYCPPANSQLWQAGLTPGDFCVRLSIQDGGPNDTDGAADAAVFDPGAVGINLGSNQLPVALNDRARMLFNTSLTIDVLANDSDADGDSLSIIDASSSFGEVAINDGKLIFTPIRDFYGPVQVLYAISDGSTIESFAVVNVDIFYNVAPQASPDSASTDDRTAIIIDVLANDTDADGDALTISSAQASSGAVTIVNNQLRFTPQTGVSGEVNITYTVNDTYDASSQGSVTVMVTAYEVIEIRNTPTSSSGGSMGIVLASLLGLSVLLRRSRPVRALVVPSKRYLAPVILASALALPVAAQTADAQKYEAQASDAQVFEVPIANVPTPAAARTPPLSNDLSMSFAINKSRHTASNGDVQGNLFNALPNANIALKDFDANNSGFELGLQYTLDEHLFEEVGTYGQWLVRAGYREVGEVSASWLADTIDPSAATAALQDALPAIGDGVFVGIGYRYSLSDNLFMQGLVDVQAWEQNYATAQVGGNDALSYSKSGNATSFSIGWGYRLNEHLNIIANAQRLRFAGDAVNAYNLGIEWKFGSTTSLFAKETNPDQPTLSRKGELLVQDTVPEKEHLSAQVLSPEKEPSSITAIISKMDLVEPIIEESIKSPTELELTNKLAQTTTGIVKRKPDSLELATELVKTATGPEKVTELVQTTTEIVSDVVYFKANSYFLNEADKATIKKVFEQYTSGQMFVLTGFANGAKQALTNASDSATIERYNRELALKRADGIKQALIELGAPESAIEVSVELSIEESRKLRKVEIIMR